MVTRVISVTRVKHSENVFLYMCNAMLTFENISELECLYEPIKCEG